MVATGNRSATAVAAAQVLCILPQETWHVRISSRLGTTAGQGAPSLIMQRTDQQASQPVAHSDASL